MCTTTGSVPDVSSRGVGNPAPTNLQELAEIDERILAVWIPLGVSWLGMAAIAAEAALRIHVLAPRLDAMVDRGLLRRLDISFSTGSEARWHVSIAGAVLNNHLRKIYQSVERASAAAGGA